MQPKSYLFKWLEQNASENHYIYRTQDLRALFPDLSDASFNALLSRSIKGNYFHRVCRGIYIYNKFDKAGLVLFHIAAILRANEFNYISLETVLSDVGVISQIPINYISIISSGRSSKISCGKYGVIEFIHTSKKPNEIKDKLYYDSDCKLWRAKVPLALRDMKAAHRDLSLIDWEIANEFI